MFFCRFLTEFIAQSGTLEHAPQPAVWGTLLSENASVSMVGAPKLTAYLQADDAISMCCMLLTQAGNSNEARHLRSFGNKVVVGA